MDLLIDTYGTFIGATGERITISLPGPKPPLPKGKKRRKSSLPKKPRIKKEYPIRRLNKIVILRPSSISMHAVQLALEHEVDIVYLGAFGKPVGRIFSSDPKGLATLRRAQLTVSSNPLKSFELARIFVIGKCRNQIRFMRHLADRYGAENAQERMQAEVVFESIERLLASNRANEELLGLEGSIAERYWRSMRALFKFPGRIPQARDKFNSALNYGYGILYNEVERACLYIGLDPYLGLYHAERYGKPALVLDLVEEFRVPVVDAAIIPLFISKELGKRGDFEEVSKGEYRLSAQGKSKVVEAVLKRLDSKVPHRGKRRTLKAAITEQSELLGRVFMEKEALYIPFEYTP
jgi:CRISPR-associated protein Cas1